MSRFRVDPRDVPADKAARRLGLTLAQFEERKLVLFDRGFPFPDETTGLYDLVAIDRWQNLRNRHLFPEIPVLTEGTKDNDAQATISSRIKRLASG